MLMILDRRADITAWQKIAKVWQKEKKEELDKLRAGGCSDDKACPTAQSRRDCGDGSVFEVRRLDLDHRQVDHLSADVQDLTAE
ncbi:uncharacterized protein V6R79_013246 [Siganus canaliculatus]